MRDFLYKKGMVLAILFLFVRASVVPNITKDIAFNINL